MCTEIPMWQGIIALQRDSTALQSKWWFYLLGKGGFHTHFTPEEVWILASLERRWFNVMTKQNIKEAVGELLFWKCHVDVDYSRNMNQNLVTFSFLALNHRLFGITTEALAPPKLEKITRGAEPPSSEPLSQQWIILSINRTWYQSIKIFIVGKTTFYLTFVNTGIVFFPIYYQSIYVTIAGQYPVFIWRYTCYVPDLLLCKCQTGS